MSTILDVAKHAGVSAGTVSNVLRGTARVSLALRQRVAASIRELEYYPGRIASHVKIRQSCMLGLVLPDITNPFFPEIVRGAEDRAFARGYLLVTANTDEQIDREEQILSALRSRRIDGVLLAGASGKAARHIRATMQAGTPVVCLDRMATGIKADAVLLDNVSGSRACVEHLIAEGHRRIAILTGPLALQSAEERLEGYRQALAVAELPLRQRLIFAGDYRKDAGSRLAAKLARLSQPPDALFVSNGVMTLGLLEKWEQMGRTAPQSIALATVDDLAGGMLFHRPLTTLVQPGYEMGARAADLLMDRVEGRVTGPPRRIRVAPVLKTPRQTDRE